MQENEDKVPAKPTESVNAIFGCLAELKQLLSLFTEVKKLES